MNSSKPSALGSCSRIFRSLRVEAPDFAGVDLGDRHLDGVFAFADFLVVLAVTQLAGNVDVLALLQRLSKLGEAAPDHDAMPLGAGVVLA